jgi:transposase
MRDIDLYRQVLGLDKPWAVGRVDLDVAGKRVDIWVEHESGTVWSCPQCGRELSCRDHAEERVWRHLDTCQFQTHLHARIPRVDCPEHGVVQVRVPWAEARSRFTLLMERLVIDVLTQCATVSGACRLLGLSWDEAWGVMERAVARGRRRKQAKVIPRLGVDEKAFRKGHDYMTVVCDLDAASVEYVAEDRTTESLEGYWKGLTQAQLEGIESVSMDMWPAYIGATLSQVPGAQGKIVFDRFHIMQHMNAAVDAVRKQEHKEMLARKDDTLKGTLHVWRYARENLPDRYRATFAWLRRLNLKVGRAWAIKESLRALWDYSSLGWAKRFFAKWFWWATHSRLEPVREVAHLLKRHLHNILTYCKLRVTNAVAEGLNSKIMAIKRRACGYRNKEHFKIAIYFFCGKLDLYPC